MGKEDDSEKKIVSEEPNVTYAVPEDGTFSGGWAPSAESFTVSYNAEGVTPSGAPAGTIDSMDLSDMMRHDAGKGMENMTFEDYTIPKPFENSVPTLEKIETLCEEYPSLKIAYDKFLNIWRICYNDYVSKNPDEENF